MRRVYRYVVPADNQEHEFVLTNAPMGHVEMVMDAIHGPAMEFWAEHDDGFVPVKYAFRVFGTGKEIPDDQFFYVNTAPRWHTYVMHLFMKLVD